MSNTITSSPWTGTNIYGQLLLLVASFFGGMSEETSGIIVAGGAGVVATFLAIRNWIVTAKFSVDKSWLKDPNNISYLTAIVVAISPKLAELIPAAVDIFDAISSKNWGQIISALVAFGSIIYYIVTKKK